MVSIIKGVFFHLLPEPLQIRLNFCGTSGHVVSFDLLKTMAPGHPQKMPW